MTQQQQQSDIYQVVIVECCQNCQSHQTYSRHSQWKYFEQFNQLKRKLEKFVNNLIVVKNPIPDELTKPPQTKFSINTYLNKETKQTVTFPRIGAFEIYIYNVLIYSKLLTNAWPNHYKVVQTINKIIEAKKRGDSLQQFSIFQKIQEEEENQQKNVIIRSASKKKKNNRDFRVYKSKEKSMTIDYTPREQPLKKKSKSKQIRKKSIQNLQNYKKQQDTPREQPTKKRTKQISQKMIQDPAAPSNKKSGRRTLLNKGKQSSLDIRNNPSIQFINQPNRIRLPSLRNSKPLRRQSVSQTQEKKNLSTIDKDFEKKYSMRQQTDKRVGTKQQKYSNPLQTIQKQDTSQNLQKHELSQILQKNDISRISRRPSAEDNRFNYLVLQANQSMAMEQNMRSRLDLNLLQHAAEKGEMREYINRAVQCENDEGFYCDFGLQIDIETLKQKGTFYVQTQKVQFSEKKQGKKPQMVQKQVSVNLNLAKDTKTNSCQTAVHEYRQSQTNTQTKFLINKGSQFPQSHEIKQILSKQVELNLTIDQAFTHLNEKRKNILDNNYYSIDRFEEKATRYKWIGRADEKLSVYQVIKKFMLECLVFCYYDFFHVKISEKRLSYQATSNVISEDRNIKTLLHIMTLQNPQIKSLNQFQQYNSQQMKYPLSQILTYKVNKQTRKFTNYGELLALAYFIRDTQIFDKDKQCIGVLMNNSQIQSIIKISSDDYEIPTHGSFVKNKIFVQKTKGNVQGAILLERTTQQIQKQFVETLIRITNDANFTQLLRYFEQTFIHMTSQNQILRNAILSIKVDKIDSNLYEQFIEMLKNRKELIEHHHKGQIYSYKKYGSLQPKLTFSLDNYDKKREGLMASYSSQPIHFQRKFQFEGQKVEREEVQKSIIKKDTILIITAESGMGKTTYIEQICKSMQQKYGDNKFISKSIPKEILKNQNLWKKKLDEILQQRRKQLIVFDEAQLNTIQIIQFIEKIYGEKRSSKIEISFFLAANTAIKVKLNTNLVQIVRFNLLGIEIEQMREYLMRNIVYFNYTEKKAFLEKFLGSQTNHYTQSSPYNHIISLIRNPFYLQLYCAYINHIQNIQNSIQTYPINFGHYSLLKQAFTICYNRHAKQCKQMQVKFEDCLIQIRKMAFEYYINHEIITENIKEIVRKMNTTEVIANQLTFYPINMKISLGNQQSLFLHREYLNYFVIDAYSFYLEKSYRKLSMDKLYRNQNLFSLIKQKYHIQKSHPNLIKVIEASRKYKTTWEQASNAITFLNKLQYVFTNLNFDEVEISEANLSHGVFYTCSFRGANMSNTILYKAQMLNCGVEGAIMDNVNFFEKKYEIEYTVLSAALSMDGKNIALGCGNFLIIINAEIGKELKKIEAHMDIIRTVKYSKDNNTLISIADDKTLRVWDTRTYKSIVFKLPQKGAIAFSSETDMIASVLKNNLKVWSIKSMANQFELQGHSDLITCLQFSSDGKYIITGSKDKTVRIWSTKKGDNLRTFKGHSAEIVAIQISHNNNTAISSSKDKDLIVWGFENGNEISKTILPDEVSQICLDGKQKFVVISLSKQNSISFLLLQTLEIVYRLEGHRGRILSLNFDADYKKLISLGKDKIVKIWQFEKIIDFQYQNYLKNKTKKLKTTTGPILGLAFCKFNNKFATSHQNGEINIYSAIDNQHIDQIVSHEGRVRCIQYDKAGKLYSGGSDGICKVWNLQARREPKNYDLFTSEIIELRLNEKYRVIAMSSANNEFVVVDFTGIKIILTTREEGRVQSIQFSKDQKIMAVGGSQTSITLFQVAEGDTVRRKQQLGPNNDSVVCMTFQGDAYLVAALKNSQIAIWNHLRSSLIKKIQNPSPIKTLLTFQKKYICFSSQDGKIRVIDMEQGKQAKVFRFGQKCTKFVVNSNQNLIYQATEFGNIVVWNLGSLKQNKQKIQFDRIAYDEDGLKVVQVQGLRELLIRDLEDHSQSRMRVQDLSSDIEGVTFYKEKIILLLKNGVYWELGKKQFNFGIEMKAQGDLYWIKDKIETTLYKTPIRKLKGLKKPIQSVIQDISF